MPSFPSPYTTISATVDRYDADNDQMAMRLTTGERVFIPWEDFSWASWFTAWQAEAGKIVSLKVRESALARKAYYGRG